MDHVLKRGAAAWLAVMLLFLCSPPVPAMASGASPASVERAEKLASLNLFRGTGVNADGTPVYNLNAYPTRLHGLIMLTRLLGVEDQALEFRAASPFLDVSGDGSPYVAYAWWNGITNGTSPTTFEPDVPLTARGYITFLLRALGYREEDGDFAWGGQVELAASLGMMGAEAGARLEQASFNRGDMVDLSYAALTCPIKGSTQTLAEKLVRDGVFSAQAGYAAGVLGNGVRWVYDYVPYDGSTVTYADRRVALRSGTVSAHVITVNGSNPKVSVKAAMVGGRLGETAPFSEIVAGSGGAVAVINANFFLSSSDSKAPIGHVMADGELLYADSGISSLGIFEDGSFRIGRPSIFTRLRSGSDDWSVYSVDTDDQTSTTSILYTPAYGSSVTMQRPGWAMTASYGVITEFYYAGTGAVLNIPANGFVVYMGIDYASTDYFRIPQIGQTVTMEHYLRAADEDGFTLDGVTDIVSGAPRLVRKGEIVTTLEEGFTEARFTTQSAPRTAVGIDGAGRLLLVCVPGGATIGQMRELMLALGCVDAFNLDGGASCGMYYRGTYLATPGRELTVTLQVFVDP